jgi:hypothetical protein
LKIFSHQNLSPEFTISAANANAAAHKAATQRFLQNRTSITDRIAINQNDNQPPNATTRTNKGESPTLSVAANWRLQFFLPLRTSSSSLRSCCQRSSGVSFRMLSALFSRD